jgi:hypothetical protein
MYQKDVPTQCRNDIARTDAAHELSLYRTRSDVVMRFWKGRDEHRESMENPFEAAGAKISKP